EKASLSSFFKIFFKHSDKHGLMSHKRLYKALSNIRSHVRPKKKLEEKIEWNLKILSQKIINLYARLEPRLEAAPDSPRIKAVDIASGLSTLCKGSELSKNRTLFALFDFDSNGVLSLEETTRYFLDVFAVMFEFDMN